MFTLCGAGSSGVAPVSSSAICIASVTLSAYMITWPLMWRGAPMVWIRPEPTQETLLVGVKNGDEDTRQVALAERLMPTPIVDAQANRAGLDALMVSISQVVHTDAHL